MRDHREGQDNTKQLMPAEMIAALKEAAFVAAGDRRGKHSHGVTRATSASDRSKNRRRQQRLSRKANR